MNAPKTRRLLKNGESAATRMAKIPETLWQVALRRCRRTGCGSVAQALRDIARAEHSREDALDKRRTSAQSPTLEKSP